MLLLLLLSLVDCQENIASLFYFHAFDFNYCWCSWLLLFHFSSISPFRFFTFLKTICVFVLLKMFSSIFVYSVKFLCVCLICSFSRFCAMRMEIGMLLHKVIWRIRIFLKPFRLFLHAFLYFEDSCRFVLVLKLWVVFRMRYQKLFRFLFFCFDFALQTYTLIFTIQRDENSQSRWKEKKQRKRDKYRLEFIDVIICWFIFVHEFGLFLICISNWKQNCLSIEGKCERK